MEILKAQEIVRNVEGYIRENNLFFGQMPDPRGKSSWSVAVRPFEITPDQHAQLTSFIPEMIGAFHEGSRRIIMSSFETSQKQNGLKDFSKMLTCGIPDETMMIWHTAARVCNSRIFSTRPDMVITKGDFKIIEYNTDGGADKGNTQGVNDYSLKYLNAEITGRDLANIFIEGIRKKLPGKDQIVIATILPDGYRTEYELQNRYFANFANLHDESIQWFTAHMSQAEIRNGKIEINGKVVDVIDREFKLPGFSQNFDFAKESSLVSTCLDGNAVLLGTTLPFQDKLLLATIFDPHFEDFYDPSSLTSLRQLHARTAVLGNRLNFFDGSVSIEDIRNTKKGWVLKRAGDREDTTGSKGIAIAADFTNKDDWKKSVDLALEDMAKGASVWVVQEFHSSDKFPIHHIRTSNATVIQQQEAAVRFAPYYVRVGDKLGLGRILVTAGTDKEIIKKEINNIHGRRDNAYLPVSATPSSTRNASAQIFNVLIN